MSAEATLSFWNRTNQVRLMDYSVIVFCMILIPSAVAQSFLGLDVKSAFALCAPIVLFLALIAKRPMVHRMIPWVILFIVILGAIASAFAMSTSQLLMAAALAVAIVVGRQVYLTLGKPKILRAVSRFTLALLLGGFVGIVYSAIGGQPLLEVQVDYRTTYLYLTTFSFALIGDFIRPSGIFDEPGAFAMYVAIVTMFNDTLQQNRKLNNVLVILIVFTGSLAGLALAVWYLVSSNSVNLLRKKNFIGLVAFAITFLILPILAPSNIITKTMDIFYSDRLEVRDGRLSGDNRSGQVEDFFKLVDEEMLLKGEKNATQEYDTYDMSSNPFSITFSYGLIISIPYFLLLLWLLGKTVQNGFRNSYTSLGLLALLLQRPYIYNMSWSILIAATVWLIYHSAREQRARKPTLDALVQELV